MNLTDDRLKKKHLLNLEVLSCSRLADKLEKNTSGSEESFQDSFFLCQLVLSEAAIEGHLTKNTGRGDSLYMLD